MTFSEALRIARENAARQGRPDLHLHLAVGFTASHLATFVTAQAARRRQERHVLCSIGPYGDVIAAVSAPEARTAHVVLIAIEWADLDPRLGLRRFAVVSDVSARDILETAAMRLDMLADAIAVQAISTPVVISLPTLPSPTAFQMPGRQLALAEVSLRRRVLAFAERCLGSTGVSVINGARLDHSSPIGARHSVRGELGADLPYQADHLAALAEALVETALPPPALKGLITDLDDTLWRGLVGEVGEDGVSWHLDGQSHIHAIYQELLSGLAGQGVLIGVASKNAPEVVARALDRPDLRLARDKIFPVEVGWGVKSEAVERILSRWNIGPDTVAFVDDSPMEVAEVQARFPDLTGLVFPTGDDEAALGVMERLRDLFGRPQVNDDDRLRAASIRHSAAFEDQLGERSGTTAEAFLKSLDSRLTFNVRIDPDDARPLELVNKTNQFNVNGIRLEAADWRRTLRDPNCFAVAVGYADKFGPLGTIAVAAGRREGSRAVVTSWVMSCRAFARRIEHATLAALGEHLGLDEFAVRFTATEKNGPAQAFLTELGATFDAGHGLALLSGRHPLPPLYHQRVIHD